MTWPIFFPIAFLLVAFRGCYLLGQLIVKEFPQYFREQDWRGSAVLSGCFGVVLAVVYYSLYYAYHSLGVIRG